jgi:hypothetical protein
MLCISDNDLTATYYPSMSNDLEILQTVTTVINTKRIFSNLKRKMESKFYSELTWDAYTKTLIKYSLSQFIFPLLPTTLLWELII